MGRPSKLTEDQWAELFALDGQGVRRSVLAKRFGITVGTIAWQADKRGLKKSDRPDAVDHRRRPVGGWPEDHVFAQSRVGMTPGRWRGLLNRRNAGEADADLALEFGVDESAIGAAARRMSLRKMDVADARYRPRGPAAGAYGYTGIRDLVKIDIDWSDPVATVKAIDLRIGERLSEGDGAEAGTLWTWRARTASMLGVRGRDVWGGGATSAAAGQPHPASAEASASLPTAGEGEVPLMLRTAQRPPAGDWATWLFLGGRGAGKTLAGASWVADRAEAVGAGGRLALIGATLHDVREVMIGGPSGVMSLPRWRAAGADGTWNGPVYEPSRRRLRFPGGAEAFVFSAEEPERLRGPQFAAAWADEFCAWPRPEETLALLRMGMRLGDQPRLVVTTTPRPIRALKALRAEGSCKETHAGTRDNAEHLSPGFLQELEALYGGTRRAAQELDGLVVEAEGALFSAEMLARARDHPAGGYRPSCCLSPRTPEESSRLSADELYDRGSSSAERDSPNNRGSSRPKADSPNNRGSSRPKADSPYEKVVVGVDPTTTAAGDACGIVVVGRRRREDGSREAVVLADRSMAGLSPEGWARRAGQAALDFGAHTIVAEVNQGGEMVRSVLRVAGERLGKTVPLKMVRAADGKRARAEPVAALYEQGRVRHAALFATLEEELMAFGGEDEGRLSLDRADALVWAVTELMLKTGGDGPSIRML